MAHSNTVWSPPFSLNFDYPSKTPTFRTLIQSPVSMRGEIRASLQPYPIWTIEYSLDHARGSEAKIDQNSVYQYLLGFFLQVGGSFSDFLYYDPYDNTVDQEYFAIGDGGTVQFQLIRSIGIGYDIVQNLNGTPTIYVNGSVADPSTYTIQANGYLQFNAAPISGAVLTWSGQFYYRVRFEDDDMQFDQFMMKIWSAKSIKLRSVIL